MAITGLIRSLEGPRIEFAFPGLIFFLISIFQEGPLTVSTQEAATKHSDLFSSSSRDKGTKSRTQTVLSLFDEEEDKTEDQCSTPSLKKDVGKVSSSKGSRL